MNLTRIVKEKGIEFLDGIPELRIHMIKKSVPSFFVEMTVPMRRGAYVFEFEILLFVEGGKNYISCYSLHKFVAERAKSIEKEPIQFVHVLSNRFKLTSDDHAKARSILSNILPAITHFDPSIFNTETFLPIAYLADINHILTQLNMDLSGSNITKDIEEYIGKICSYATSELNKESDDVKLEASPKPKIIPITRRSSRESFLRKTPKTHPACIPDSNEGSDECSYEGSIFASKEKAPKFRRKVSDAKESTVTSPHQISKKNSETQTIDEGSNETEDLRLKLAASLYNERRYEDLVQELCDRLADIKAAGDFRYYV